MPGAPYGAGCSLPGRGEQFGFKQLYPVPENVHALVSKFFEAFSCIFGRAYAVGVALLVVLVGIAHELFLKCFGPVVAFGQR